MIKSIFKKKGGAFLKVVPSGRITIIGVLVAILGVFFAIYGVSSEKPYLIPFILFAYLLATYFDVPLPGLGHVSSDHIVVFPAVLLLGNPFLAGLLNGFGYILERAFRFGPRGVEQKHWLSFFTISVNSAVAAAIFQATGSFAEGVSLSWSCLTLFLALLVFALLGFLILLADRVLAKVEFSLRQWFGYLARYLLFLLMSSPFLAIFLLAVSENHIPLLILSFFPLISTIWSLRINFKLVEKNSSLIQSTQKQEFLQQIMILDTGSLDDRDFLASFLNGLKDFVKWDRDMLFLSSLDAEKEPIIFSTGALPADPHQVIGTLEDILQANPPLKTPIFGTAGKFTPLLDPGSRSQIIVPLSTEEISFGILVLERTTLPNFEALRFSSATRRCRRWPGTSRTRYSRDS